MYKINFVTKDSKNYFQIELFETNFKKKTSSYLNTSFFESTTHKIRRLSNYQ